MVLKYDYDIRWVIPREAQDDPAIGGMRAQIGFQHNTRANYVALFRDAATAEALAAASPALLAYFKASGFGLESYASGAPEGHFPASDLAARNDVIDRLTENLAQFDVTEETASGFDFGAFLDYEITAQPIEMATATEPGFFSRAGAVLRKRLPSINPLALGISVLVLVLMPYLTTAVYAF